MATELVMLVGLPASGKSTVAKQYAELGFKVYSSDAMRKELYGDEEDQSNPTLVFETLHRRVVASLRAGDSCVIDATNLAMKKRMAFLRKIEMIECKKTCVIVWARYETCLERDAKRSRHVGEAVLKRMYNQYQSPAMWEGWDEIKFLPTEDVPKRTPIEVAQSLRGFDQENKHHSLSLGDHMIKASECPHKMPAAVRELALVHDMGKPQTKFFKDNGDTNAHYYCHDHVGAYDSFMVKFRFIDNVTAAAVITYHMYPYLWKGDMKMKKKFKKMWDIKFRAYIRLLHLADEYGH